MKVELLNTLTFACGKYLSRSANVSSIIPANSGWAVGSPLPAKGQDIRFWTVLLHIEQTGFQRLHEPAHGQVISSSDDGLY